MTDMEKALRVLVLTPHIRAYLTVMDPKALAQAQAACGIVACNEWLELGDVQVIWDALQQFADNSDPEEGGCVEGSSIHRKHVRARALVERIETGVAAALVDSGGLIV